MNGRVNVLRIRTPEGMEFALLPAGPVSRMLAWLVDLAVIGVLETTIGTVLGLLRLLSFDLAMAAGVLAYFAISIGYGMLLEWRWRGQTIGKRLLRLRVVDERGLRLMPQQVVVRNLLRFVDMLPAFYLVGGCALLMSSRSQRLGDFAAGTIVVRIPRAEDPDLQQITAGKYNSFRKHPHIEARLRQVVSAQAATLALQTLLRRAALEDSARLEIFRELADHFKALAPFPPEAVEDLSDEQYVRNAVETLYRR